MSQAPADPVEAPPVESALDQLRSRFSVEAPRAGFVLRMWLYKFTPFGRAMVLVLLVSAVPASGLGITYPLYHLAVAALVFLLMAQLLGLVFVPRVEVARTLPDRVAAGATLHVVARVTHTGRLPLYDFTIWELAEPDRVRPSEQRRYLDELRPGEQTEVTYALTPLRRGAYDFKGPQVATAFPFGVYHTARRLPAPHRMLVYPRFAKLDAIRLPTGRKHQPGGLQLVSHVGDSEEFIGLREYRPGDRLRDLHHRAWARVGRPVVREYQQEYLTRIALVVDTFAGGARPGRRDVRRFEAGISLGAAVADVLSRQEYVVDIFAAGPDLYHFQAGRSLAYLDDILDVLACVDACPTSPFQTIGPALLAEIAQLSTAVVVMLDWDAERREFVRQIQEQGVEVKLVVVRDGEPSLPLTGVQAAGGVHRFTPAQVEGGVGTL